MTLKKLLADNLMHFWVSLFHLMIVDGKYKFFKKGMSRFKKRDIIDISSYITRAS